MSLNNYKIEPKLLYRWLVEEKELLKRNVLFLDFHPDGNNEENQRVLLSIIFKPKLIKGNKASDKSFWVGCEGADIGFYLNDGVVVDYTSESKVNTKVKMSKGMERTKGASVGPEITLNSVSGKIGTFDVGDKNKDNTETTFKSSETILTVTPTDHSVEWSFYTPKNTKVVKEFLHGTLILDVECKLIDNALSGAYNACPHQTYLYDQDRKRVDNRLAIIFQLLLNKHARAFNDISNKGFEVKFTKN